MNYNLDFLQNFDGNMHPRDIKISDLINVIEKHVSQFRYFYSSKSKLYTDFNIELRNDNIPHLLGLSKNHNPNLPTYRPNLIISNLKNNWDLDYLISTDNGWFSENQDKLVGILMLYQLLHIQNCKVFTTQNIINTVYGNRFKRDKIYFVIHTNPTNKSYTIELSKKENSQNTFFPKSLKINDTQISRCSEFDLSFVRRERLNEQRKR